MSAFINMQFVCSQISLPACSVLFKNKVHAKYPTRSIQLFGINVYSLYTVMVLILNIILTVILIKRTRLKYSFPSRKEMLIFLKVYLGALVFDLVLSLGIVKSSWGVGYAVLVSFQTACAVTCFVSAMCTGLVWMVPNRVANSCKNIAWLCAVCSLSAGFFGTLVSITSGVGEILFMLLYVVPLFFSALFSFTQLSKLKILNSEIWIYGSLLVTILLVISIALTPVVFGMLIVMVSDRYLDGIFLIHVLGLFSVIKIYDLWCVDNEQEIECVNTIDIVNK